MENYAIKFENVSKIYKLKKKNDGNTKSSETKRFYALKNISFEIPQGELMAQENQLCHLSWRELAKSMRVSCILMVNNHWLLLIPV